MSYEFLKEDALEYGYEVNSWPKPRRLAAAIGFYKADRRNLTDAIGDLAGDRDSCVDAILMGLEQWDRDPVEAAKTITPNIVLYLRDWPLDLLAQEAENMLPIWQGQKEQEEHIAYLEARAEAEQDRRREEQWEREHQ